MPQKDEHVNENSLIRFFKNNEYLFTILGVFLVLAFIFNTPQLISLIGPQSQATNETIQLQCSINKTDISTNNSDQNQINQINCTGNRIENSALDNNPDFYYKSTKNFSFICLLMSLIVYLSICYNLYLAIRECVGNIANEIKKDDGSFEEIKRHSLILFIIPFFYQGAIWFIALLFTLYPDMMADAFFSTALVMVLIEFFGLVAIASEFNRLVQHSKKKTLVLSFIFLIVGILMGFLTWMQRSEFSLMIILAVFSGTAIIFSYKGFSRYWRNRDTIEFHDVI
jgi:hypothetical protein